MFEDQHLVVIDKPAGLLSQGEEKADPNVVDWMRGYLQRNYVGLVHRLDRNVSGLMVVAKRSKAAARLTKSLQAGEVKRIYWGFVLGWPPEKGRMAHWLWKDTALNQVHAFAEEKASVKPLSAPDEARRAVLKFKLIDHGTYQGRKVALLQYELETGRSHQIRVQTAVSGHPLLGDRKYGAKSLGHSMLLARPALHAHELRFPHPMSEVLMRFKSPLPEELQLLD